MSEEEKKAIKLLKDIADIKSCTTGDDFKEEDAKIILNLIDKQHKVIEEMAISLMHNKNNKFNNMTLEEVEKHFYRKVKTK